MTYTYDELRHRIPLLDFAQAHGYVPERRKGSKWPVLRHPSGDRVIIVNPGQPSNQGYFNPGDDADRGTLIQFVTRRMGWLFPEDDLHARHWNVNRVLHDWLRMPMWEQRFQAKVSTPSRHGEKVEKALFSPALLGPLRDPAWLLSRGIRRQTLAAPPFEGRVLQCPLGRHANIAFPYRAGLEGPVVGAEVRNRTFKGHLPGSARSTSLWFSRPPERVRSLLVCESALDALSHHQIQGGQDRVYASFGGQLTGGQIDCLRRVIEGLSSQGPVELVVGVDADEKGQAYADRLMEAFPRARRERPEGKDFNEMLQRLPRQASGMSY